MDYAMALPNTYAVLTGLTTPAGLVAALVAVLESVGWVATSISGGFRCLGASPQGYQVYADIWAFSGAVCVQLSSTAVVSPAVGYQHFLNFAPGMTWQIAAHPAGFAISQPGVRLDPSGTYVFAGIPRVPDGCGLAAAQTVTEVWLSFGDAYGDPFFTMTGPRQNLDVGDGRGAGNQTGCFNGEVYSLASRGDGFTVNWSEPQIIRQSSAAADTYSNSHPLWFDGTDLVYPAMIAWGAAADGALMIRGQIYNAVCRSSSAAMDATRTWSVPIEGTSLDMTWINYTDSYYWGSLWLAMGSVPGGAEWPTNVA